MPLGTLNWGAIFGGTFTSIGLWTLLGAFGLAAGLSAVSPQDTSIGGVGTWLGIWSLIVPVLAMFAGVLVAARAASVVRPMAGIFHGVVVWGLTTFLGAILLVMTASSAIGAAWTATKGAVSFAGQAASTMATEAPTAQFASGVANFLGLDRGAVVAEINRQLPPERQLTVAQLQNALQDAVHNAVRRGYMNQDVLIVSLTRETPLTEVDARKVAAQFQRQWHETAETALTQLETAGTMARRAAFSALDITGKGMWWLFGSMLLGLGASIAAGYFAASQIRGERPLERMMQYRSSDVSAASHA